MHHLTMQSWLQVCQGLPSVTSQAASKLLMTAGVGAGPTTTVCKPLLAGCLFDMDGTLTEPVIDFALMRQRSGILEGDILAVLDAMPPEQQARARAAIEEVEEEGLKRLQLMRGLEDLCAVLDRNRIPRALITRNNARAVEVFHARLPLAPFAPALSREFKPCKPDPAALLHICSSWGLLPQQTVMVGDSAKDDIVAGRRAGCRTVLLDGARQYNSPAALEGELRPDHVVGSLGELASLLQEAYTLAPGGTVDEQLQAQ